jgi:hypothetical protein
MVNLVAMNIKRKDAEVASHGFSMFLDPKRIKLQVWHMEPFGYLNCFLRIFLKKKTYETALHAMGWR